MPDALLPTASRRKHGCAGVNQTGATPVLSRVLPQPVNGAPYWIRTSDPQLRSLWVVVSACYRSLVRIAKSRENAPQLLPRTRQDHVMLPTIWLQPGCMIDDCSRVFQAPTTS
jgi:hypothetical protein